MNALPPASTGWDIPSRRWPRSPSTLTALFPRTGSLPQLQPLTAVGNPHPCSAGSRSPPLLAVGGRAGPPGRREAQPGYGTLHRGKKPSADAELCLSQGARGVPFPQVNADIPLL